MLKRVYLEITNRCNLNCSFCQPHHRPLQDISPNQFTSLLEQLQGLTHHLYLHVKGEPLLHPQLAQLLALCHQYQFAVNLTTNGTLLTQQQEILLSSPALRQINISVHSFTAQTEQQQQHYLQQLLAFAQQAAPQMYVNLRFWNRQNGMENPQTQQLLATVLQTFPNSNLSMSQLQDQHRATLMPNLFLSLDNEFQWPSLSNPYYGAIGTCYGLRQQMAILVDGTLVPCCLDGDGQAALGNVFTTPLRDILQSSTVQAIQQGFQQNQRLLPLCQHCSFQRNLTNV